MYKLLMTNDKSVRRICTSSLLTCMTTIQKQPCLAIAEEIDDDRSVNANTWETMQ